MAIATNIIRGTTMCKTRYQIKKRLTFSLKKRAHSEFFDEGILRTTIAAEPSGTSICHGSVADSLCRFFKIISTVSFIKSDSGLQLEA